jgi:hypothetical protein
MACRVSHPLAAQSAKGGCHPSVNVRCKSTHKLRHFVATLEDATRMFA